MSEAVKLRESVLTDQPALCPDLDAELRRELGMDRHYGIRKSQAIWKRCAEDPAYYIFTGFIRTSDEKQRDNPRRRFPDKPYLREVLKHIHTGEVGDIACVSKSRQFMVSWLLAAYASWEAKFHEHARVMYQGKKADDSQRFIFRNSFLHSRVGFIERALPLFLRSRGLKGTKGDLWYENGSVISAIPKGADMARSFSASLFLFDEAAFQDEFGPTYKAVLPMAKGNPNEPGSGGRIVAVSSAQGGTDWAETIEQNGQNEYHKHDRQFIRKGIEKYETTDGVRVMMLHYSADPMRDPDTKEGVIWLRSYSKGWKGGIAGSDWQQEMENNYEIQSGNKVWPDFDQRLYPAVTYDPDSVEIQEHWPIYAGVDWGIQNPTVFTFHAVESLARAYQFDEVVLIGKSPQTIAEEIKGKWYWKHIRGFIGDPSIWRRMPKADEPDMTSVGEMFANEGIHIAKGRNEQGVDMVYITQLENNLWADLACPKWMISRACTRTINSYRNVRYVEQKGTIERDEPEKIVQKGIDPFDANKYWSLSIDWEQPEEMEAPPNSFGWWMKQLEERVEQGASWLG